jgi:S1-C subfamily serine protease
MFPGNRGKMGLTISIEPEASDSIGALVDAVTPAGPAYVAGIRANDIIVVVNGRSLVQAARETGKPTPGLVLIELASQLKAGDTARVEYRRGQVRKRADIVLERTPLAFEAPLLERSPYRSQEPEWEQPDMFFKYDVPFFEPSSPGGNVFMLRTRVMDLELAPMNPGLGQYFGVNDGVLVISVPDDTQLNLRAGDVVIAVDGRRMANPGQMFRALASYEAGEDLKFDVMRMKRRETVTGRMGPSQ